MRAVSSRSRDHLLSSTFLLLGTCLVTVACGGTGDHSSATASGGSGGTTSTGGSGGTTQTGGSGGSTQTGGSGGTGGGAVCGNGKVEASEECDDSNTSDADRCSASCKIQEVVEVVAGYSGTCVRLHGGKVKCFGDNEHGQLGLGDTLARGDAMGEMGANLPEVQFAAGTTVTSLVGTNEHRCVLLSDGKVACWGLDANGQLGEGNTDPRGDKAGEMGDALPAVDLGPGAAPAALATGYVHSCAVLGDGSIKCWGTNGACQLGQGTPGGNIGDAAGEMGSNLPVTNLGSGVKAKAVAAGNAHTCALLTTNQVKCWGSNTSGQLGLGDSASRGCTPASLGDNLPMVDVGGPVAAIALGNDYSCALLQDGSVKCWGANDFGQLGAGKTGDVGKNPGEMGAALASVDLGKGKKAIQISAGKDQACALLNGGEVKCWGRNSAGQLGQGSTDSLGDAPGELGDTLKPIDLGKGRSAIQVSAGHIHACAVLDDGSLKCWGNAGFGALGQGDVKDRGAKPGEMGDALPAVKLFSDSW